MAQSLTQPPRRVDRGQTWARGFQRKATASADLHDQRAGAAADTVGPGRRGAAHVWIGVDAKLAEPRDLGAIPWVGDSKDHTQRRVAERTDASFDQIGCVELAMRRI
jgi:hypothetical protein